MSESESTSSMMERSQHAEGFIQKPLFQRLLVEVCLIIYSAITNMIIPLTQQYLYYLVKKKYTTENVTEVNDVINSTINTKVEQEATLLVLYLGMMEHFPTTVIVLAFGLYSDVRGNRRLLIWLPCLGNIVYGLGYLLPLYISGGDIDHPATKPLLYCGTLLYALTGNTAGYTVGLCSYISDTDTLDRRNLRLSLMQIYFCFTYALSNYVTSSWLQATQDYSVPYIVFIITSVLLFLLYFLFLIEPEHSDTQQMRLKVTMDTLSGIKDLFRVNTRQRRIMWSALIAFSLYCFVQQGQERMMVLFLKNEPLAWDNKHVGTFFLVTYLISGFGIIPGALMLERYMDEASVNIVGMFSFCLGSMMLAFAKSSVLIYLSSVVKVFYQIPWAYARSLTSKQASEKEQGSIYAIMHFCQLWMLFLGSTAYSAMFFATIQWMNGFVFAISAVFIIPSIVLLFYDKYLLKSTFQVTETESLIDTRKEEVCVRDSD